MSSIITNIISLSDTAYPTQLKEIHYAPKQLFLRGDRTILQRPMLAVVGTRKPSAYGLSVIAPLLEPVIRAGITIVSGLALGIDGRAHQVSVNLGAPTIAVLGCGVDIPYPWEHRQLAQQILDGGGAIISEFSDGTPPLRHHFPQRNRIISGLAQAVLLVEAGEKSGALITAKFAVEQNRDVLIVPGPITSPQSLGPLNWLKHGATPVTTAADILDVFHVRAPAVPSKPRYIPRTEPERLILDALAMQSLHIDELSEKSRLDSSVVSATLALLEMNGAVHHLGGLVYSLS